MRVPQLATLARLSGLLCACLLAVPAAWATGSASSGSPPRSALGATGYEQFEGQLTAAERRLFADAADGRLDEHSLLAAALVACGVDDGELVRHYEERLAGWVDQLARSGRVVGTGRQQAQAIFEFMHQQILRGGYSLACTDLRTTLDEGRYNCVSASLVFQCLAQEFGLRVCGLETRGHAMSRLILADGSLDVETTYARWFRLPDDPQPQVELSACLERLPSPAARAREADRDKETGPARREVNGPQLAAMIYYNRGVDLLAAERYAEALAANAKALRLDPANDAAWGNLLATLNNWAIALGTAARYADAAGRLEQGMRLDPGYETFASNYVHVCHEWIEALCRDGQFAEAAALVRRARQQRPDNPYFPQAARTVERRWSESRLTAGGS